jgi:very-short-patch-repair endonuclease
VITMYSSSASSRSKPKVDYKYGNRYSVMSPAERDFFKKLSDAVGNEYYIFPQVHLSVLVDHTIVRQYYKAALSHIDRKSVDFILCDKNTLETKLAIEIDDHTHTRLDRIERDGIVEDILKNAGVKLVRFENHGTFNSQEIFDKVRAVLK